VPAGSEVGTAGVGEVTKVVDWTEVAGESVGVSLITAPPEDIGVSLAITGISSKKYENFIELLTLKRLLDVSIYTSLKSK